MADGLRKLHKLFSDSSYREGKTMKKNVYLTIITIITVLAIVLGVLWRFTR